MASGEAARSFNSLKFFLEIWERESAPAVLVPELAIIYERRLFGSLAQS